MTIQHEPTEDRLDRVERILAETVAAQGAQTEQMDRIQAMVEANTAAIAALGKRVDQLTGQQQRNNQDLSVYGFCELYIEYAEATDAFDIPEILGVTVIDRLGSFLRDGHGRIKADFFEKSRHLTTHGSWIAGNAFSCICYLGDTSHTGLLS